METSCDLTKMQIVMSAPCREDVACSNGSECRLALLDEEVVISDGVQPVRLGASNGAELMQHHLKITVAIATRSCGRFGVDRRPVGFWSLKGHSESRAEVIKILVDEVADDLEYGPV